MSWEIVERKALRAATAPRVTISAATVGRTPHLQVMMTMRAAPEWMCGRKPVTMSLGRDDHAGLMRLVPGGLPGSHLITIALPSPGVRTIPTSQIRIGAWEAVKAPHPAEECRFTASETEVIIWLPEWAGGNAGAAAPVTTVVLAPKGATKHTVAPPVPEAPALRWPAPNPVRLQGPVGVHVAAPEPVAPAEPSVAPPPAPEPSSAIPEPAAPPEPPRPTGDWLTKDRRAEMKRRIEAGEHPSLYCPPLREMPGPVMPENRKVQARAIALGIRWTPPPKPPTPRPDLGPNRLAIAMKAPEGSAGAAKPFVGLLTGPDPFRAQHERAILNARKGQL